MSYGAMIPPMEIIRNPIGTDNNVCEAVKWVKAKPNRILLVALKKDKDKLIDKDGVLPSQVATWNEVMQERILEGLNVCIMIVGIEYFLKYVIPGGPCCHIRGFTIYSERADGKPVEFPDSC